LALLAGVGIGCSVQARSDGFRCTTDSQCGGGRICDGDWCVLGARDGGADLDATVVDAFACPDACTACVELLCVIDCDDGDCVGDDIVCPPGFACEINCDGIASCTGGTIDCSDAVDCRVNCDGDGSCDGAIACNDSGPCRVDCGGVDSCAGPIAGGQGETDVNCETDTACAGGVDCADACSCEVDCLAVECPTPVECPPSNMNMCVTAQGGCTDVGGQCDSC
jgi:hypothetical protein